MEHVLSLKNDITEIKLLPVYAAAIGKSLKLSQEECDALNLVLEEAVSNIIFYAYPQEEEHQLTLAAVCEEDQLTLSITDEGIPFDPTQQAMPDTTSAMEKRAVGGLGIYLMSRLMDKISYRRENTHNILTLYKRYGGEKS